MFRYFIHRLLLVPITLIGITFLIFCVTRMVPGGPVDRMLVQRHAGEVSGRQEGSQQGSTNLNEAQMERMENEMLLNQPICVAYLRWLGVLPREIGHVYVEDMDGTPRPGWQGRKESPMERAHRWAQRRGETNTQVIRDKAGTYPARLCFYRTEYAGILQGQLGMSYKYHVPVWQMIKEAAPVSLYLGIISAILTYGLAVPLGAYKALYHSSWFDSVSSFLLFLCYAVPGFALGAVFIVFLCARLDLFPLYGLTSSGFSEMDFLHRCLDLAHHTVLPVLCYTVGSLSIVTMLTKNSLMENMSMEYVRTAQAKGLSFKQAIFRHALPNSFIPLASCLGGIICTLITGSLLIEKVFDIRGFGLLSYQALIDRDYALIMGTLLVTSALMVLGNILSDFLVALIDPRVKFRR